MVKNKELKSKPHKSGSVARQRAVRVAGSIEEVFAWVRSHLAAHGTPEDLSAETFAARLRYLWKWSNLTAEQLSEALEVSPSTFGAWLAARSSPGLENLVRLETVTGVSVQWLATGRPPMVLGRSVATGDAAGFVYVPRYDVRVGAGNGQLVESERIKGFLAFREDWVRTRLRRNPANLVVFEAYGDSMSPTISDGDIMLVDTSEDRVRGAAIYVVRAGNEAVVKRVELMMDGSLVLKSDNEVYEPWTVSGKDAHDYKVLGKVVWSGGLI